MKKPQSITNLNIVPSCKVTKTVYDEVNDKMMLRTIAKCLYTSRAIAKVLTDHELIGKCTWIIGPTGKELWLLRNGSQLAVQI